MMQRLRVRSMSTLLLVEHKQNVLSQVTLNALTAAQQFKSPVTALLAGDAEQVESVLPQVAAMQGVKSIIVARDTNLKQASWPELVAPLIADVVKQSNIKHVVAAHTTLGKSVIPRAAALLDVAPVSDVTAIEGQDTFVRPIYAGNAIAKVKSTDAVKLVTIRTTSFPAAAKSQTVEPITPADAKVPENAAFKNEWVKESLSKSDRPELSSAPIVVSGGRGLKSGDNFQLLYKLADKLGAAVGASRAAVDAGFVPNDMQVGQTGQVVAPKLYIAVGISGAIQHLAGMKDSKVIVAINKDPEAPIFQVADYGLVADLFQAVPEMTEKVSKK